MKQSETRRCVSPLRFFGWHSGWAAFRPLRLPERSFYPSWTPRLPEPSLQTRVLASERVEAVEFNFSLKNKRSPLEGKTDITRPYQLLVSGAKGSATVYYQRGLKLKAFKAFLVWHLKLWGQGSPRRSGDDHDASVPLMDCRRFFFCF